MRDYFREKKPLTDHIAIEKEYEYGLHTLEMLKRQVSSGFDYTCGLVIQKHCKRLASTPGPILFSHRVKKKSRTAVQVTIASWGGGLGTRLVRDRAIQFIALVRSSLAANSVCLSVSGSCVLPVS